MADRRNKAAKLSYGKLVSLLRKHGYITTAIYYIREEKTKMAIFFECRLPQTQKNILVYIPSKYLITLPANLSGPRLVEIVKTSGRTNVLTEQSVHYLLNVRGPLIESDLAAVSADGICHSKFSGEVSCYFFTSNLPDADGDSTFDDDDEVAELRKDLEKISSKLKSKGVKVPQKTKIPEKVVIPVVEPEPVVGTAAATEGAKPEGTVVEGTEITAPEEKAVVQEAGAVKAKEKAEEKEAVAEEAPEDDGHVELVFEGVPEAEGEEGNESSGSDDDGEGDDEAEYEDSSDFEEDEPKSKKGKKGKKSKRESSGKSSKKHRRDRSTLKLSQRSNQVIAEELDVHYGVILVVVDLTTLHSHIATYEADALDIYEQLDENERDGRTIRVSEIRKQLDLSGQYLEKRVREIQIEENELKHSLLKLTAILQDADNLKGSKSVPDADIKAVDKLYNKTRKTIHELNTSILRQRDEIEDLLVNYEESLKELFEL